MRRPTWLCLCVVVLAVACAETLNFLERGTPEGSAEGDLVRGMNRLRKSFEDLDPSEEHYIGRAVAAQVVAQPEYALSSNEALTDYVNRVGNAIVLNCEAVRHTFIGYHFAVLDTDEINAFAAPGGTIFVTRGLIRRTLNEDELAGVLAHEIAHVSHRHGLGAIKNSNLVAAFQYLASGTSKATMDQETLGKLTGVFDDSIKDITSSLIKNGYGRDKEYEADKSGAAFAAAAGYQQGALREFIQRLGAEGGSGGVFATHPAPAERLQQLGSAPAGAVDAAGVAARVVRYHRCVSQ
jgi:predicted Zn-dependent protease